MSVGDKYWARFFLIVHDYYSSSGTPVDPSRLERIGIFPADATFSDSTLTFTPVEQPPAILTAAAGVGNW